MTTTTTALVWLLCSMFTTSAPEVRLASDCNPGRKDPPNPNAPTPPKDAKPPGGYNPKV